MKQYVVDELRPEDHGKLKAYLDENLEGGGLEGLYWKSIDTPLLSDTQATHPQCGPFYVALVLSPDSLCCELLVRTRNRIRCDCIAYATPPQRDWLVAWMDDVFDELGIIA